MIRFSALSATLAAAALICPVAQAADLTVSVEGISQNTGAIMLGLFDETTYEGNGLDGARVDVDGDRVTVTFEGLEPGEYAIKLYHDVNDDGEMNTNPFGMPTEPFAFSNDAKGRFGPAKWDAAKFSVGAEPTSHTITMN